LATLRIEGVTVKTTTLDIQEERSAAREQERRHLRRHRRGDHARAGSQLDDVGRVAAFAASDHARTMTATALNITCGSEID
jgi:hypothetical protein